MEESQTRNAPGSRASRELLDRVRQAHTEIFRDHMRDTTRRARRWLLLAASGLLLWVNGVRFSKVNLVGVELHLIEAIIPWALFMLAVYFFVQFSIYAVYDWRHWHTSLERVNQVGAEILKSVELRKMHLDSELERIQRRKQDKKNTLLPGGVEVYEDSNQRRSDRDDFLILMTEKWEVDQFFDRLSGLVDAVQKENKPRLFARLWDFIFPLPFALFAIGCFLWGLFFSAPPPLDPAPVSSAGIFFCALIGI